MWDILSIDNGRVRVAFANYVLLKIDKVLSSENHFTAGKIIINTDTIAHITCLLCCMKKHSNYVFGECTWSVYLYKERYKR